MDSRNAGASMASDLCQNFKVVYVKINVQLQQINSKLT